MGSDTPATTGRSARVELRLSGGFVVVRDGAELEPGQVGSRKSRLLLKLLSVARPGLVATDQIAEVLWNGSPPGSADRNIASLVSRLRSVLGPGVIVGGRNGYRLGDGGWVSVDLDVAARLCQQAEIRLAAAPAVALTAASRASELLSAGVAVADEPYAAWADPARAEQRSVLRRARLAAAEAALATGDPGLAARYAEAAIAADNLDEAAHRWYMSAAAAAGEQAQALLAYERLRERLSSELGADPAPQTRDLHLAILRDEAGATTGSSPGTASETARPAQARGVALAGRAAEIALLRSAWRDTADRKPSLILIVGEAGIGKTALAEFIAAEAAGDGATVMWSRCYETERSLFVQPVVEALTPAVARLSAADLRDLLGPHAMAAAATLPAVADVLGPSPPERGSLDTERRRAFDAVTALLRGLAERHPVLLVVDDLQYAGQSTVELLHFLGRRLAGSRLLVVITTRAEHAADVVAAIQPLATTIEVGPLDSAAVQELAAEAGQSALAADILQRTRGHALFVVEVLRALRGGDAGVPQSLRSVVQARARQGGGPVDALLRAASVVGAALDPLLLAALLDLPSSAAVGLCEQALAARLLVVSGRHYEFANDLIREVLYATTPEPTRLAYHQRAADLLTAQPEALAEHAAASGDWPRAARAWLLAAEKAMSAFAASDAVVLAGKALDAASQGSNAEVAVRAQVIRGRAHEALGAHAVALADFMAGADRARAAGDLRQEMHVMRDLGGDAPVALGLPISYCESHLAKGLHIAESLGDRASQADLLGRLAIVASNRLQLGRALELAERAVATARAAADEKALATGLDGLKIARLCVGDATGVRDVLTELEPLLRRQGDLFRLHWAEFESAFVPFAAANWDEAEARIRAAIQTNRRAGYPASVAWYTTHLGLLARLRGDGPGAAEAGREALALAEEHRHSWWIAAAAAGLGTTLLQTGNEDEATAVLEEGLTVAEKDGAEAYVLRCLAPLAALTGSAQLLTRADALLGGTASAPGAWIPGYEAYLFVARAWLSHGQPDRARDVLAPLLAVARDVPWTPVEAEALAVDGRALTALGQAAAATTALQRAAELAAMHGMPHVLAAARSDLV